MGNHALVFSQTLAYGKKQSGHEKRSPDGLSLHNQNTIIINIIL